MSTREMAAAPAIDEARAKSRQTKKREPIVSRILEFLGREPAEPTFLAEQLESAPAYVSRILASLAKKGFVSFTEVPGDARRRRYELTAEGEVQLREHRAFGERPERPAPRPDAELSSVLNLAKDNAVGLRRRHNGLQDAADRLQLIYEQAEGIDDHGLALEALAELVTTLRQDGRPAEASGHLEALKEISLGRRAEYSAELVLPAAAHYHYGLGRLREGSADDLPLQASYLWTAISLYDDLVVSPPYSSPETWRARRSWSLVGLAHNLRSRSMFGSSLKVALRALRSFEELEDLYGQAQCLFLSGFCLRLLGHFDQAGDRLEKSHRMASDNGFKRLVADSLMQTGEVLRCRGESAAARDRLEEALTRSKSLGLTVTRAFAQSALGAVACGEGRLAEAKEDLEHAERMFIAAAHKEGHVLNGRRQAVVARRIAEEERARDLSSVEDLITATRSSYEVMRRPAGITACDVELGRVRMFRRDDLPETVSILTSQLKDSEIHLMLELDPWVPGALRTFAHQLEDESLVERSDHLMEESSSRLRRLTRESFAEDQAAVPALVHPSHLDSSYAEMGGETREEGAEVTGLLAAA